MREGRGRARGAQHDAEALPCDEGLANELALAARDVNSAAGGGGAAVPRIQAGAGHDAMAMGQVMPVGMLFVRCRGGVSHSPAEYVSPEDVGAATTAALTFLHNYAFADRSSCGDGTKAEL